MGGIYTGIFTPTEAAGFGALGALIISIVYKKFSFSKLGDALGLSMRVSCMIMWLVIGGGAYSTLVTVSGTGNLLLSFLSSLDIGPTQAIIVMLLIPLIMGCFIDPVAISMICIPIFIPLLHTYDINVLYFVILFIIALVTGFVTPPFGLNIFYMKGVAPENITIIDIYKAVTPYTVIMIVCLVICIYCPAILLYLPGLLD
jgi:tripartite ATP-independent transporter DctM subunit